NPNEETKNKSILKKKPILLKNISLEVIINCYKTIKKDLRLV
ncbi:MAG: hypothetical protein ACJAQ1_001615, partial [Flavobacterium sp.]